jgi:hypothetical protein
LLSCHGGFLSWSVREAAPCDFETFGHGAGSVWRPARTGDLRPLVVRGSSVVRPATKRKMTGWKPVLL